MKAPYQILIVDDGEQNRLYFTKELQAVLSNSEIIHAEHGQQALALCQERLTAQKPFFDLIIMDYQMPLLNGADTTKHIRKLENEFAIKHPSIIITWSSATNSPYPLADDALTKYFNRGELRNLLRCYHFSTK